MRHRSRERPSFLFSLALSACAIFAAANSACVKLPRAASNVETDAFAQTDAQTPNAERRIDLNRASVQELEKLPGFGPALAARIVAHRERHGPFRRVEHLLAVRGISERRFAEVRAHVTIE